MVQSVIDPFRPGSWRICISVPVRCLPGQVSKTTITEATRWAARRMDRPATTTRAHE